MSEKKRGSYFAAKFTLFLLVSAVLIVFIKHTFMLLIAGMLPSIVAVMVERTNQGFHTKIVTAFNFSGVIPYVADLYKMGNSASAVQEVISQPEVWLVMYGAAGAGWGMILFLPGVIAQVMDMFFKSRIEHLEEEQKTLEEEWGPEIRRG